MQKIDKGFVILCKDGKILATEDRKQMENYIRRPTDAVRIYAYPKALLDSISNSEARIEELENEEENRL